MKQKKRTIPYKISFLVCLFVLITLLSFFNLGDRYIGGDELDTVVSAQHIDSCGVPSHKPCPDGTVDIQQVPATFPWTIFYIVYYVQKVTDSRFAIRFLFALAGLASSMVLYLLSRKVAGEKSALITLLLLALSPLFYLLIRQARYFSFCILFSLLSYYSLFLLLENARPRHAVFLGLSLFGVFLFNPQIFIYVSVTIYGYYFFINIRNKRRLFPALLSILVASLGIVPFLVSFLRFHSPVSTISLVWPLFLKNIAISLFYYFLFMAPFIILLLNFRHLSSAVRDRKHHVGVILVLLIINTLLISLISHNAIVELRKLTVVAYPLILILLGTVFARIRNPLLAGATIAIVVTSNIAFVFPFNFLADNVNNFPLEPNEKIFLENSLPLKSYLFSYLHEATAGYTNIMTSLCPYMKAHNTTYYAWLYEGSYDPMTIDWFDVCLPDSLRTTTPDAHPDIIIQITKQDFPGYRTLEVNSTYNIWEDTTDLSHHKFRWDSNGKIYISLKEGLPLLPLEGHP